MIIYLSGMSFNSSLEDGPGVRSVIYFQGCDFYCKGCHNKATWKQKVGQKWQVEDLITEIKQKSRNKITISGGEPLLQLDGLRLLLKGLSAFDIALYTAHLKEEVPQDLLKYLTHLKTGPYQQKNRTTCTPFVGSTNQIFQTLK